MDAPQVGFMNRSQTPLNASDGDSECDRRGGSPEQVPQYNESDAPLNSFVPPGDKDVLTFAPKNLQFFLTGRAEYQSLDPSPTRD